MRIIVSILVLYNILFSKVYTLKEVYEAAFTNSDSYHISSLKKESSNKEVDKTLSAFLPTAKIENEYFKLNEYPVIVDGVEVRKRKSRRDVTFTLEQTLYDRSKYLNYKDKKVIYNQSSLEKTKEKQQLIFDVIRYYFEAIFKANQIELINQKLKSFEKIVERAKAKFKSGLISKADYLEAKLERDESLTQKLELEYEFNQSKSFLEKLANLDDIQILDKIKLHNVNTSLFFGYEDKYKDNLDLKIQKMKLKRAEINKDIALSKFEPTATLTYEKVTNDVEASKDQNTINFLITMNIFNGMYDTKNYQQTKINNQIEKLSLNKLEKDVKQNIKNKIDKVVTFYKIIQSYPTILEAKKFALEGMRERFQRGTKSIIDLLDEENKYFEKLNKYTEYEYQFVIEYTTLKQYTNSLDEEFINKINGFLYE
ncbi:outer membrane efflux protein [Arcobacter nitrofigilis DSM 7299]|uniref:Outer membrane efflux protein n=1 Tax=Arcobacter nitrofigilis (strain ATCC 33309 / DSM 7299 / CCUG 15893 / LMG 7604 / NCTC 12251 / CI) TaxID=572480 RepID=D5V5Y6_ARCNC|nr:TolC family protein [Arcobacter nitrofigilis]ADG93153.1 outer membrane efflux protein [Arcobacter nitrofigilis DSM 7299]